MQRWFKNEVIKGMAFFISPSNSYTFGKKKDLDVFEFGTFFAYRKFGSTNTSHLEAHPGLFRLLINDKFDAYGM